MIISAFRSASGPCLPWGSRWRSISWPFCWFYGIGAGARDRVFRLRGPRPDTHRERPREWRFRRPRRPSFPSPFRKPPRRFRPSPSPHRPPSRRRLPLASPRPRRPRPPNLRLPRPRRTVPSTESAPVGPVRGEEYGNSHETSFEASVGRVGRSLYVPIWTFMPLPKTVDNRVYDKIPGDGFRTAVPSERNRFRGWYEYSSGSWKLKDGRSHGSAAAALADAGGGGYDIARADYKSDAGAFPRTNPVPRGADPGQQSAQSWKRGDRPVLRRRGNRRGRALRLPPRLLFQRFGQERDGTVHVPILSLARS